MNMQPTPAGWPRISSSLFYADPRAAIAWLCKAFGFEVRLIIESKTGGIEHSELVFGDGVIMVADASKRPHFRSPKTVGGNTQAIMIYVDDADAHCAHARAQGAVIFTEPTTSDYGPEYWSDRSYGAVDQEGHHFWFVQRLRSGSLDWTKVRNKVDQH